MTEDFLSQLRRVNGERWDAWTSGAGEDPLYQSNEFGGEAGEVQNIVKKLVREARGWRGSRSTPDKLADEIADCIICLDSLARSYGIDIVEATVRKFNTTSEKNDFPHRLSAPSPAEDTVAFVQQWMASSDHEPDQWHRDFAAAIDVRCASPSPASGEAMREALEQITLIVEDEAYKIVADQPICKHINALNEIHEAATEGLAALAPKPDEVTVPEGGEVDRIAKVLMETWYRVDPKSDVTRYPASFIANFADMARAVIAAAPKPSPDRVTEMKTLISKAVLELQYSRIFISTREKMHPAGIALYDQLMVKLQDAIK